MMRDIIIPVLSFALCNCVTDIAELEVEFCKKGTIVRATSFNIKNSIDKVLDPQDEWQTRRKHVHSVLSEINSDIYAFQEVTEEQLEWLTENLNGYSFEEQLHENRWGTIAYDVVLAWKEDRFYVRESGSFWTSENYDEVAVWAILRDRITNKEYYVVNIHFSGPGKRRREQFNLVKANIGQYLSRYPVILMGDFNASPDPSPWEDDYVYPIIVNENFLVDGYKVLHPKTNERSSCGWEEYCEQFGFDLRIDLVLHSSDFKPIYGEIYKSSLNGRNVSDHFPVVLDLTTDTDKDTIPACFW